ncbi:MaoC/PaaZ C-terminal domain-containing protein [Youngiibacter fragilis]|uniref:MaoC family dehydratase n=1 Tax=Youngiibacter fragilis 232.1 TaxID=994573 RepID=V7I2V8_9CLOT|nr:MaoC/PaaZ C-terminal domain-containing protein [Youngiibacter fragilis]ETA79352.1 MaoC family dehydratase [Youngiibacter fragilis 232.1]
MVEYKPKGLFFEDFEVGQEFATTRRTVTDGDVVNFACLTGDFNPIHIDEVTASEGPFKKRIAHGLLGVAIMNGQMNQLGIFEGTTIAKAEDTNRYKAPIFIGDTVSTLIKIVGVKPSSKGGKGTVLADTYLINQRGEVVTESSNVILIKGRK